jgi:CDP-diacylglycerol--glycerol-3-phosphate 3-phosphatidyltransferase
VSGAPPANRFLTVPNALSLFRILAAPVLVVLATSDRRSWVIIVFVAMTISDWIDGKLAIWLNQRSRIGPRLDSVADLLMYAALLASAVVLDANRVASEWPWVGAPFTFYLLAGTLSLKKFGRWPHHHTRMAKISWGIMFLGAVAFLADWSRWPLRLGLLSATLASIQSMLITRTLTEWREDVPSMSAARQIRSSARGSKLVGLQ